MLFQSVLRLTPFFLAAQPSSPLKKYPTADRQLHRIFKFVSPLLPASLPWHRRQWSRSAHQLRSAVPRARENAKCMVSILDGGAAGRRLARA